MMSKITMGVIDMLYYVENEDVVVVQVNEHETTRFSMSEIIDTMEAEVTFFSSGMGMNTPIFRKMRSARCDKLEYRFNWISKNSLEKDISEIEDRLYCQLRSSALHLHNTSTKNFSWSIGTEKPNTVSLIIDFK